MPTVDLVNAAKAKILLRQRQTVIDAVQLISAAHGTITINGDGSITVNGRNLNNVEMIALADALA